MLTFAFVEKNDTGTLFLDALSFELALEKLKEKVKNPENWRCENEDGEQNEEDEIF